MRVPTRDPSAVRPLLRRLVVPFSILLLLAPAALAQEAEAPAGPVLDSMSALAFGPGGVLFVGDARGGSVVAIETGDTTPGKVEARIGIVDLETRLAAMLGSRASEVLIHDLAVNPISQKIYLAVSRGRAKWESRWQLPNDLADAAVLVRVDAAGELEAVDLEGLAWSRAGLPDPVDASKAHRWKRGVSLRVDTITDLAFEGDSVWVTGLSNEEFASTAWKLAYPFTDDGDASKTTLEIFHGAHGEWETHAPIRTFVPYRLGQTRHLLAAYLCTPLVTFETETLAGGGHVKGRTVAELGSGNYPLDMVVYQKDGKDRLLIANSNLPLMIVDPADVASFDGSITSEVEGYTAGVSYEIRSGTGIQQLDRLGDEWIVALQRLPGGTLDLVSMSVRRF
ncbi:MAG: hypothetical protein MI919_25070 [Holophagales bacterium]|nr:hypothetical protein [Holophagales bacterium]